MKDLLKKHGDTLTIIGVIFTSFFWINAKFESVGDRLTCIEKDVDRIKTVLIMQRVWPEHLAEKKDER